MSNPPTYHVKEQLASIAAGDSHAFQQLFKEYWRKIYSIALLYAKIPAVAEDATQEVFIQIWKKRENLLSVTSLDNYLFTTAKHIVFNMLRKRIFSGEFDAYLKEYFADSSANPVDLLELKDMRKMLEAGIGTLTPQQEKVFRLSREHKLSHAEIAQQLGLSQRTVKNYMISALLTLRNYVSTQSDIPITVLVFVLAAIQA